MAPYSSSAHTKGRDKEGTDAAPEVVVVGTRTVPCAEEEEVDPIDDSNSATVAVSDAVLDADSIRS